MIDDFSTDQDIENSCTTQAVLGGGMVGGEREVRLRDGFNECEPATVEVSNGALTAHYDAPPFSEPIGDILEIYLVYKGPGGTGLGPADLTDAGLSDRFIVEVSDYNNETCGPHSFRVTVGDPFVTGDTLGTNAIVIDAPGTYEALFSEMLVGGNGADLSAADQVVVLFLVRGKCIEPSGASVLAITSVVTGGIADADGDGVPDGDDLCPGTAAGPVDAFGCSDAQVDADDDSICDPGAPSGGPSACTGTDNCPATFNELQLDSDGDGAGDLCDLCPLDDTDSCDPDGSDAQEITPADGGTVETGDGLTLEFDPGDLAESTTIVVSRDEPPDPDIDLFVSGQPGLGSNVAAWDFQPDGLMFTGPVLLTVVVDVSGLNPMQRGNLDLYREDGMGTFEALGADCPVDEDPPGVFTASCTVEIMHFTLYAALVPLDSDDDGVPDMFNGVADNCPFHPNPGQEDICTPILKDGFENLPPE